MGFEVDPQRLGRGGSGRRIGGVVLASVAVIALAVVTMRPGASGTDVRRAASTDARASDSAVSGASASGLAAVGPSASPTTSVALGRPIPPTSAIECHDISALLCRRIVQATMRIIPASLPPVAKVAVWPSLLCGDASDCPPSRLAGREKLGSAVVTFEPTQITAWANVVGPPRSPGSLARPQPIAWVIRVGT